MGSDAQGLSTKKILTTKNPFIKPNSKQQSFDFLLRDTEWEVSEKYDGVKIYAWRRNEKWNEESWADNWVFSYKGSILFPEEYEYLLGSKEAQEEVRKEAKASSQYVFFLKHFKETHEEGKFSDEVKNSEGRLYFMEYIMKKATLALEYDTNHKMFLISYFDSVSPQVKGDGNIIFGVDEGSGKTSGREELSDGLNLDSQIDTIYKGDFSSESTISNNIISEALKEKFSVIEGRYDTADDYTKVNLLNEMFLSMPSSIGGLTEGVVLISDEASGAYAFNRERVPPSAEIKAQIGEIRNQNEEEVLKVIEIINEKIREEVKDFYDKKEVLNIVSTKLYSGEYDEILNRMEYKEIGYGGKVEDASVFNKRDMVYLRFKMNYLSDIKYGKGNISLVPGKFRIVTNGHKRMFDLAAQLSEGGENVIITLVGTQNVPKRLRIGMINLAAPDAHIIEAKDANLKQIIDTNKLKGKVRYIVSGTDREAGYEKQVELLNQQGYNLEYKELKRVEGSESATEVEQKVREGDFEGFKSMTPFVNKSEEIYDELRKILKVEEHLLESKGNSIDDIKELLNSDQKVYILYGGGIGSGKSYHAENNFSGVKVVDMDDIAVSMVKPGTPLDQIPKEVYNKALKKKLSEIQNGLNGEESFIEMATSSNLTATQNKLQRAKENGFVTAFIFVDVPLQVSIQRNRERIEKGGRGIKPELEYKVERTNNAAREVANKMKNYDLVDIFVEVPYKQDVMESIRKTLRGAFFG